MNAAIGYMTRIGLTFGLELSTLWLDIDIDNDRLTRDPGVDGLGFEHTSIDALATMAMSARYRFKYVQAYLAAAASVRKHQDARGVTIGVEASF